jgi:hypothetical protein
VGCASPPLSELAAGIEVVPTPYEWMAAGIFMIDFSVGIS